MEIVAIYSIYCTEGIISQFVKGAGRSACTGQVPAGSFDISTLNQGPRNPPAAAYIEAIPLP